jgi:Ca2+-binding RTX toxin-like protein
MHRKTRKLLLFIAALAVMAVALPAAANAALIVGTPASDFQTGTPASDTIVGLGGNDLQYGLAGNDLLNGGDGHDRLFPQQGRDVVLAGNGNDVVVASGDGAQDRINCGYGLDRVYVDSFDRFITPGGVIVPAAVAGCEIVIVV